MHRRTNFCVQPVFHWLHSTWKSVDQQISSELYSQLEFLVQNHQAPQSINNKFLVPCLELWVILDFVGRRSSQLHVNGSNYGRVLKSSQSAELRHPVDNPSCRRCAPSTVTHQWHASVIWRHETTVKRTACEAETIRSQRRHCHRSATEQLDARWWPLPAAK